jgi:integrase
MRAFHANYSPILEKDGQFVEFSQLDLVEFSNIRGRYLTKNAHMRIKQITSFIWNICKGRLSRSTLDNLTEFYMSKYPSESAREKCFNYTRAFMKYLFKIRMNTNILSFIAIFEKPKSRRETKLLTSRIIIQEDIKRTLDKIHNSTLPEGEKLNYESLILFLSYGGQRVVTASRLTVNQFKEAMQQNPKVLTVEAEQDKIRLQHYVPLHPVLLPYLEKLIEGKTGTSALFDYLGLQRWLKFHPITLNHTKGKLELKDLRKFFEQTSDSIGFNDANKNFIMSHGVSSINWTSYKQFLPENVYARYIECWQKVKLI